MNDEERFMYDLLLEAEAQSEEEDELMYELLLQEEEEFDEDYDRISEEFERVEEGRFTEEDKEMLREIESEYELDPFFPDDDWLEAGEEWELAPDYSET